LDRQVAGLVARVARQPGWQHVATYGDQDLGAGRPGLSRLLAEAPGHFDLVVVDGYGRLSPNRQELNALLAQLGGAGIRVVVLRPSASRRFARLVANVALADMIGEVAAR
jgi:DNA invertase Pin-like site-specific DNA recombinase